MIVVSQIFNKRKDLFKDPRKQWIPAFASMVFLINGSAEIDAANRSCLKYDRGLYHRAMQPVIQDP